MNHFAIGTLSFVVAVMFVVTYLAHFQLRRLQQPGTDHCNNRGQTTITSLS